MNIWIYVIMLLSLMVPTIQAGWGQRLEKQKTHFKASFMRNTHFAKRPSTKQSELPLVRYLQEVAA